MQGYPNEQPFDVQAYTIRANRGIKINLMLLFVIGSMMYWLMVYANEAKVERQLAAAREKGHAQPYERILLFDGVCVLCNGFVDFLLHHDHQDSNLRFAPLQSDEGKRLLDEHELPHDIQSVVLVESGTPFVRSTAIIRIFKRMPAPWSLLYYPAIIVFQPIRDAVYDLVAATRFSLFGQIHTLSAGSCSSENDAFSHRIVS